LSRLCINKKHFSEMDNQEQNATVHAAMVLLGKGQWAEASRWLGDVWKPVGQLLRSSGASALAKRDIVEKFWKQLQGLHIPELEIISQTGRTPSELKGFFTFLNKFYDESTGDFAEADFLRKMQKSPRMREVYAYLRPKIVQYLQGLDRKTPEGLTISSISDAFAVTHREGAPPIPESITNPIGEGGMLDYFVESLKKQPTTTDFESLTTGTGFAKLLPSKEFFRSIGKRFGKKFSKLYLEGEDRRIAFDTAMRQRGQEMKELLGPYLNNVQFRERLSGIVENAMNNSEHPDFKYFQENPPTSEELRIAARIRSKLDEWGKRYAVPRDAWLTDYLPRIREKGTYDPGQFMNISDEDRLTLKKFFIMERTGLLNPKAKDILEILKGYTRTGEKNLAFFDDGWFDRARSTLNELRVHPREYEGVSNYLADIIDNASRRLTFKFQAMDNVGKFMEEKFHIPAKDTKLFGGLYLKSIYAGALGFRVVPLIKQAFQTLLLGGSFYGRYLAKGIEAASKAEAWEYVRRLHILPEYTLGSMGMGPEIEAALSSMGSKWVQRYSELLDLASKGYMKADSLNRVIGFWSGKSAFLEATEKRLAGKISQEAWERAVKYRWFDGFGDLQEAMKSVLEHPRDKELLRKVSDMYGRQTTEDFNWVYRRGNAPLVVREHPYILQFGTWPANFASYLRRMTEYSLKTKDFSMPLRLAGIGAATYAAGRTIGLDLRSVYAFPSGFYTGGPTINLAFDTANTFKSIYYGNSENRISFSRMAKDLPVFLPAGLAVRSFVQGVEQDDLGKLFGVSHLESQD